MVETPAATAISEPEFVNVKGVASRGKETH
jgi:hypothetical protein